MINGKFIYILLIIVWGNNSFANYTPHEKRFYKAQVSFIKKNWHKLVKNESEEIVETDKLISIGKNLKSKVISLNKCEDIYSCKDDLISLRSILQKIETECLMILSKLGALKISTIEKNPTKYTQFIKKITDINHSLAENQIQINEIFYQKDNSTLSKTNLSVSLKDILLVSENLTFQIQTIPQVLMYEKVKNLLIMGNSEFIENLTDSISQNEMGHFHELDKVFNVMNRDMQKNKELLSSSSRSILLQIHQRWNAILKIVKRK